MTGEQSPAERYSSYRAAREHPVLHGFRQEYPFELDDFQVHACREVEDGKGVLVAAPTGSGKTVVGEFAVFLALATGRKAFYTTPIKALSNQKYHDLVERHGVENVGLLTGDHSVNGEAPVVVMTTEVLRNMLYAGSRTLLGLAFVVMDEVHYLADRARGAVWEEVIIHLPESVQVISLSATVSNAEEFGEWLETVRGETTTIVEERRPVPLFQHVMVGRRLMDLFASSDVDAAAGFVREGAPVNPELKRIARDAWASRQMRDRRAPRDKRPRDRRQGGRRNVGNGRRVWVPSRVEVLVRLERDGLLPAIVFIFSRAGCDAAVQQCLDANLRLTTPAERDEILEFASASLAHLPPEDLEALGFTDFLDGLSRGVAAHHAGLLPAFKECVEKLFVRGLVKAVFATETLALGINMPARTVVIEKLTKFNGETHASITPGEYTQLTGRAGRRGLDVEGHAVVLFQQDTDPGALAGLASTRTYPLNSSFRPSYNMAVNLVHQFGRARARELLEMSFAQFQADRSVVGLARQLRKAEDAMEGYAEAARCHLGDFLEYAELRRRINEAEKGARRARRNARREQTVESLLRLRTGDVIDIPQGKYAGFALVLDPGAAGAEPRPQVITVERQVRRLGSADFSQPVQALARMKVPRGFNGRNAQQRRDLARALVQRASSLEHTRARRGTDADPAALDDVAGLRAELQSHPCHRCPDREDHARWAERWQKLRKDSRTLQRRVEQRTNSVARTFDRVCAVLAALDYLSSDGDDAEVTERGMRLRRLYTETDLLAAEALRQGLWDGLSPAELASVLSVLVYESRREPEGAPRVPRGAVDAAITGTTALWRTLRDLERDQRLDFLREPDAGFAWAAWRWASGDDLDEVLMASPLSAGDFVRWTRQLVDLAGQVADAAGDSPVRRAARDVVQLLRRGVIADSSVE